MTMLGRTKKIVPRELLRPIKVAWPDVDENDPANKTQNQPVPREDWLMTKFFQASLFADTARWNATAVANIVHFSSGWYHFRAVPLPTVSLSHDGIHTWGELIQFTGTAIGYGVVELLARLPSHIITALLIYVWCHDTLKLYREAKQAWQVVLSNRRSAKSGDPSSTSLLPFVDGGLHI
jgi:hypothetical protein